MHRSVPTARRMSSRIVLRLALVGVMLVAALMAPSGAGAASAFSLDLATRGDYVAQTNLVQCVGASMQMMANMVAPRDDRSAATQRQLQSLARSLSGPRPDGRDRRGAGVRGWAAGLNHLGVGPYQVTGESSLAGALKMAARAIRMTGRPVGLLVWRGRHAWVMSGFEATGDPAVTDRFEVTAAFILDPLYPHGSRTWGLSPRPGHAISVEQVGRQFVARDRGAASTRWLSSALAGMWVLVLPVDLATSRTALHHS